MLTHIKTLPMLIHVKTLSLAGYGLPTIEDLKEAQEWTSVDCVVKLLYRTSQYDDVKEVLIEQSTDIDALNKWINE